MASHTSLVSSPATTSVTNNEESTDADQHWTQDSAGDGDSLEKRKRLFGKELRCMMYGFGDDHNPFTESVDMLEDLVIQFIGDISLKAQDVGRNGKISVEDVLHCMKRDERKYARVRDLLSMNEELKKARKAFDEIKYVSNA
ncbi:transcription initiation factor TFIID subunit 13-like [Oppia nitens]|uniref:transcription initiation factor TFIID subunit 13-like n=1 Tax=Oppia nitens TaxID=1686743 RepID=UPI0023D9B6AD|nr:transcription initiation factor TFIID subunit 13-like [Oppia nitens]